MATSYTSNLALALPATGELSGTWGSVVNSNITNMLDEALGYQVFTATGGSDTLTIPDGTTGVARSIYIQLNGTGGGTVNVPTAKTKMYFVFNNTVSASTFKVTGQTGVSIPAAAKIALVSNGTDIIVAENYFPALTLGALTLSAPLSAESGGTGVANNAAMTVTGSGNFAYTRTLTAATNVTFPTTGTLATLAGTETLTNKTLTNPTITNPTVTNYTETPFSANSGTAITLDLTNGTVQIITLTGNATITRPTATSGKSFVMILRQDATGGRTVTWSTVKYPNGNAPVITSTASRQDIYSFFADGTNWYGVTVSQNYTP